jgi:uncharacterized protein (TIGR03067 family)
MLRILVSVLMVGCLILLPLRTDDTKKEQEALQGTWKVTKLTLDGQAPPDGGNATLTFTADEVTPEIGGNKRPAAKYKLDPSKSPKQIDITTPENEMVQGIYEIKEDVLKLCMQRKGGRPTSFDASGEGIISIEAKKEKK